MTARRFNRFMIDVNIGTHRKIRRLAPAERWCFVAGVLALAAESPIRGALLVTEQVPLEFDDFATHAGVPLPIAKSTLAKLHQLGVVCRDDELGCDVVRDWGDWQAEPKLGDPTAARRKALSRDPVLREMVRARDGDDCRYCGVEVNWTDRRSAIGGTYDHVDPNGQNLLENLVVACRGCNAKKGARTPAEAGMDLGPRPSRDLTPDPDPDKRSRSRNGSRTRTLPPKPPNGGRKRDRDLYDEQIRAWVSEHLPEHPLKTAIGLTQHATSALVGAKSVEEIVAYVHRQHPIGAPA